MAKILAPIWPGIVESGNLTITDKYNFKAYLFGMRDGPIEVIVRKAKRGRSNAQNRYYWGVVLPMIAEEMGELICEEIHDMLRGMFLLKGIDCKGRRFEVIRSTTDLSTMEFEDYLEKVRIWAGLELNMTIPLPNEVEEQ